MKKREQQLTTKLLKRLDDLFVEPVWCEVKVVERPRKFSTKVLSEKAKAMLRYTKMTHKFSDFSRMGTPLDFVYLPKVKPWLCVIFYKARQKSKAYWIRYDGTEYLKTEEQCAKIAHVEIEL